MIASPENCKDVSKYFEGTYIIVPEVSEKHVMYLKKASAEGIVCQDSRTGKDGFISFEDGFTYEIKSPLATRKAWFAYTGIPHLISRVPARMWRKGISTENTVVHQADAHLGLRKVGISTHILNAYLQCEYDNALIDGKPFQLLSPEWLYNSTNNILSYWSFAVGKTAKRTKELFIPREYQQLPVPKQFDNWKVKYV